jgi:phosphate transport system substrate-binding protein
VNPRNIVVLILCLTYALVACNNQPEEVATVPTAASTAVKTATSEPTNTQPTTTSTPDSFYDKSHIRPEMQEIAENFPNIASSTSAKPLWNAVMCNIFAVPCNWFSIWNFNTAEYRPEFSYQYSEEFMDFMNERTVKTGTHEAYISLINSEADIILTARQPSEDEINAAHANNVDLDVQPVALDAFVFIVNAHNPVDNLSLDQIRAIYSGEISNWSEVGGPDKEINIYQRDENSGSQELMKSLVMQDIPMVDAPNAVLYSMAGPYEVLSSGFSISEGGDVTGIAYTVYFYAKNIAKHSDIEFIGVNGVEPTQATIYNGRYPLTTEVYVVLRDNEPTDSIARQLRDWLLTEGQGQSVVGWSGYIPLPRE